MDTYDDLLGTYNELVDDYNDLLDERNELLEVGRGLARDLDDVKFCLQVASTLEAAKACEWQ